MTLQLESQELATWLAQKQRSAVQQLKALRHVLENAKSQADAAAERASSHHANLAMLAQKEQQYVQQLQLLEEKLINVKYSPLVRQTAVSSCLDTELDCHTLAGRTQLLTKQANVRCISAVAAQCFDGEAGQV